MVPSAFDSTGTGAALSTGTRAAAQGGDLWIVIFTKERLDDLAKEIASIRA